MEKKKEDKNGKNAMNAKTQKEKDIINQERSKGRMNRLFNSDPEIKNIPGIVYLLRFYNDEIEFWKVGITSRTIKERFRKSLLRCVTELNYEVLDVIDNISFYEAFKKEQEILRNYKNLRINIDYNGFKTTEAFCERISIK
jgi:hypothetical protein